MKPELVLSAYIERQTCNHSGTLKESPIYLLYLCIIVHVDD